MVRYNIIFILLVVIVSAPFASGLAINSLVLSPSTPNGQGGFYNRSFNITAVTDSGPATLTYKIGSDPAQPMTSVDNTNYYAVINVQKEGSYTITVLAVNASNSSINATGSIPGVNIDSIPPEINYGSGQTEVNVTSAVFTQSITVNIDITDVNPKSASIRVGAGTSTPVNLNGGETGSVVTTPESLGCTADTTCTITVRATDDAGNVVEETVLTLDVTSGAPSSNDLTVEIISPVDSSAIFDSIVPFSIKVTDNNAGVPSASTRFCYYRVYTEPQGFLESTGTLLKKNFTVNGNVYSAIGESYGIEDGDYRLEIECFDASDNSYQTSSLFEVLDTTPPTVFVNVYGVTNSTANLSVNSTEEFMIKSLEYKIIGEDNASSVSTQDGFGTLYDFTITGLISGAEYVVQVKGIDAAGEANNRDDNEFVVTELFRVLGAGITSSEIQEKSVDDVTTKGVVKNQTASGMVGEKYSHGIDWLREGEEKVVTISNFDMSLRELAIESKEDIRNVKLDIVTSENPPDWLEDLKPLNSSAFQYFSIIAVNAPDDKLKYAKIRFEVNQIWLRNNDLTVNEVALYRYKDDKWNKLPTSLIKEGALLHTFEALSPGFSLFLVAGKEGKREVEAVVEKENKPTLADELRAEEPVKSSGITDFLDLERKPWYFWAIGGMLILILLLIFYYMVVVGKGNSSKEELLDHKLIKTHMTRLEKFVDEALRQGYTKDALRENLTNSGWDKRLVEFVLRRR